MMSGSWMGSHFTNDDLVKENTFEDDYTSVISFQGERNGKPVVEITSVPKENAAVVWGKVITIIDKSNLTPIRAEYYDEDGTLVRHMEFSDIKNISGHEIPMIMRLIPVDKPGESTVVEYHELEFDIDLQDSMFSLQSLQQQR